MKEINITDIDFYRYLQVNSKKWTFKGSGPDIDTPYTDYFNENGTLIAKVIYNNRQSTRKIYIPTNRHI